MSVRDIPLERFRRALRTFGDKVRADAFAGAQPVAERNALHRAVAHARMRVEVAARHLQEQAAPEEKTVVPLREDSVPSIATIAAWVQEWFHEAKARGAGEGRA